MKAALMTDVTPYLVTAGAKRIVTIHGKMKDVEIIKLQEARKVRLCHDL